MKAIIVKDPEWGFVCGTYDVFYWVRIGDRISRAGGFHSNVSDVFVDRIKLAPNQAAQATCRSHPHYPDVWLYGSAAMRASMNEHFAKGEPS